MKKLTTLILSFICILGLAGCGSRPENTANVIEGNIRTYSEMPDGTWQAEGKTYKYRLEISGRMPNAATLTGPTGILPVGAATGPTGILSNQILVDYLTVHRA